MKGILPDNDLLGHVRVLLYILERDTWRDVWRSLDLSIATFQDLGLAPTAPDNVIWQTCQQADVVLITGNRNEDGPDSLETTIRKFNMPTSLPVLTVGDTEQVLHSRAYADRIVERLLEYLMDIDNYRGAGRLYLP